MKLQQYVIPTKVLEKILDVLSRRTTIVLGEDGDEDNDEEVIEARDALRAEILKQDTRLAEILKQDAKDAP